MWPKQSRKSPPEASDSPLPQPAWKRINYVYSGSPDSPCIRRSVPRLSYSDDIKRNLSNITDDDYDRGYSAPASLASFSRVTNAATIISSSSCNSIDSGFQSPTGLQSPLSGTLSFSLTSQPNSLSSPLLLGVKDESQFSEEKGCELLVSPDEAIVVDQEFTSPSPVPGSSSQTTESLGSTQCPQLIFTTPVQDKNEYPPDISQNVLSTSSEKPGASSVKIIFLNSSGLPSSSPSAASLQSPPAVSNNRSPPKDVVIEIFKSHESQTPKFSDVSKNKEASCTQTPNGDQFSKRPSHSYEKLIKSALNSRPDQRMKLKEIRKWVEDTYPFYKNSPNPGWKDSIRHNLSVSKLFVKESPKYGSYWKLASNFEEPATSPQVPPVAECQTQLSNSNSNSNSPVPAFHVFNTVNKFPTGNSNPQSQAYVHSARQKVKLKKKGPLPILPRLNVDPQTYVLVPLQYLYQNNIPIIPQLPSTQSTSGSPSFMPVIAQSTPTGVPVTSTPISASSDIDITAKDLLTYQQSPVLSPLATNQIRSPNPCGQTTAKAPVLQTAVQPCQPARSPDRSKSPHLKRICAKPDTETKSKLQESPSLERSVRKQKLSSDRKSRRKQRLVCKDMSPINSSHCDAEMVSPERNKISISRLPKTPTNTNFSTLSSIKTPSPSGRATCIVYPSQNLLPSLDNSLLQTPPFSQKLMLGSFDLSPNSVGLDTSLKDGNLSSNSSDSINQHDNQEFWDLLTNLEYNSD